MCVCGLGEWSPTDPPLTKPLVSRDFSATTATPSCRCCCHIWSSWQPTRTRARNAACARSLPACWGAANFGASARYRRATSGKIQLPPAGRANLMKSVRVCACVRAAGQPLEASVPSYQDSLEQRDGGNVHWLGHLHRYSLCELQAHTNRIWKEFWKYNNTTILSLFILA